MGRKVLRFGPACYHVVHLMVPVAALEMNFFYTMKVSAMKMERRHMSLLRTG